MNAFARLAERIARADRPLVVMSASGQLGYGIPMAAFRAGVERQPDFIGVDMGSIDPGPYYLGAGKMATAEEMTRRDLRLVLTAARELDVPLVLGTAGTAGAEPHLAATLALVREIAAEEGLHFTLASIRADVPAELVVAAQAAGKLHALGPIAAPTPDEIRKSRLVAQMGVAPFAKALEAGADIVIAGRACDTAVYSAIPKMLGYPVGLAVHMAKLLECTSLCCTPGGRDAVLGHLDHEGFVVESMNPSRHATPVSVAAHSLYEQADPFSVVEPEGILSLHHAEYVAVDAHRTRVSGASWQPAARLRLKVEGATFEGYRSVLAAASADPGFIASLDTILKEVEAAVRALISKQFRLFPRIYGTGGVSLWPAAAPSSTPPEIFLLLECVADTEALSRAVLISFKQHLLHHGFPGRICTGGNLAFPITPPEIGRASCRERV